MEIWQYFALFHLIWGTAICLWFHRVFHGGLDYILKEDEEFAKNYQPFRRTDIPKWNRLEIYIGATLLLPYRILFTGILTITCGTICYFAIRGVDLKKEIEPTRKKIIGISSNFFSRVIFFVNGFYYLEKKNHRITDLDPTYPKDQTPLQTAPIIVSNHISFIDIFYFLTSEYLPGFLSKDAVAKVPFVGTIAKARQSIFVDRVDRTQKDAVLLDIKGRVEELKSGKSFPPILIFPEGTTSDSKTVIAFKKGAFCNFSPVRIMALEYPKESFSPAYDNLEFIVIVFGLFSQFYNRLRIHDCGVYDPTHLNLKEEKDWERYAEKVKAIMCKSIGAASSNLGYQEKQEYYRYSLKFKKELRERTKQQKKTE